MPLLRTFTRAKRCCVVFGYLAVTTTAAITYAAPMQALPQQKQQQNQAPFEAEIAAFEAADKKNPPPKGSVLFVGSSSIRFWTTLARDFPELTVINRGFGGSVIADSVRYAPRIVIPYKPRMIVLYAGGNDINSGESPALVLRDFRAFVNEVHAALPGTRIIYISMNPSVSRWNKEAQFVEGNRLIAEYIRNNEKALKLSFIDSHLKLLSPDGQARPDILRADGLHLNVKGYALWTAILRPQILALVAKDQSLTTPTRRP